MWPESGHEDMSCGDVRTKSSEELYTAMGSTPASQVLCKQHQFCYLPNAFPDYFCINVLIVLYNIDINDL